MVRRVAAVEGDELITDDPADASYTIPEGALFCTCHTGLFCCIEYFCGFLWVILSVLDVWNDVHSSSPSSLDQPACSPGSDMFLSHVLYSSAGLQMGDL